ncbi:MAG: sugar ABC transporter permease YjfF [Planctomycetota bacterium]|jgi:simple sugar transport system permease protein|nr:sugar ABC transporter permease YjfF [Planctomycetota bacterium]
MNRRYLTLTVTAFVLLLLYGFGAAVFPNFLSLRVIVNLFGDNSFTGISAVGMTIVIISGGIDLSVASVIACTTIFIAQMVNPELHGWHPLQAMAAAVAMGAVFGAAQGFFISFFNLHPYLVTLSGMFFARGVGYIINDTNLAIKHPFYSETVRGLSIPLSAILRDYLGLENYVRKGVSLPLTAQCFILFVVAGTLLLAFTRFGRYVYAIGSNEASARLMGVPVDRMKIQIYALSGFCAAAAGCVVTFYMQAGNSSLFVGLEMDAIAATVIGGTLLTGGVGGVPGTLMGVLILGLIQTLITFHGNLNNWWAKIFIGALLFLFISIQQLLNRGLTRRAST